MELKSLIKFFFIDTYPESTGLSHHLILHSLKKSAIGHYSYLVMTLMKFL